MRGRSITFGLAMLLVLVLGAGRAAADPPGWSNGHHNASPTPSPTPPASPSPTPTDSPSAGPGGTGDPASSPTSDPTSKPPGNNGVVKVDARPFDDAPNNEPHVGCTFQIDLYGYDQGNLTATYTFELWQPTGSGPLLTGNTPIGEDPAGGGTDLDASVTVGLESALSASGAEPHPNQGFHVRLTVHAQGSIGADTKHKMFWVTCAPSPAPTTAAPSPPTSAPSVLPSTVTPPPSALPTIVPPPSNGPLAFTGNDPQRLVAIALALLLFGTAALRASQRRERRHYDRG